MDNKTATLHNLGCKVNSYEAQAVEALLAGAGYTIVPFGEKADLIIINTCSVTAVADKKSRQMLHKAKKINPDALVIAMGCYAETGKEDLIADGAVDIIIGNNKKNEIIGIVENFIKTHENTYFDEIDKKGASYEELKLKHTAGHTRAFVKIQDGCDRFCTYCIIPYARGRIRSRKREDVLSEMKRLSEAGVKEVVLTGIHLSSYGKDEGTDCDLITLIELINDIEGIERIRLGSLEAGIITEEFVKRLSKVSKVCPHFHLSLQSGCDNTLKRMNRHYTAKEFKEKCEVIRKYFDRPALTTDVIAGFPGETEEDFKASYDFVESIGFYETHIFPYSKREGTKAAAMKDQLSNAVKNERAAKLIVLGEVQKAKYLDSIKDMEKEVLFEDKETIDGKTLWVGYTTRYEKITKESEEDLSNSIIKV